jgi:serine/threonine-protein kinase
MNVDETGSDKGFGARTTPAPAGRTTMNPELAHSEDQYAAKLAAHDEALAAGRTAPDISGAEVPAEVRPRLERDLAFLHVLQQLRPSQQSGETLSSPGPGSRLEDYELLEEIGRGGMGVVHRARQIDPDRLVAIKQMCGHTGPVEIERFRREAENMRRLRHPNIVEVYAVGFAGGLPFFAMELAEGGSLAKRIHGEAQPAWSAARLVETLARAVAYAHEQGLIHRDLKPANVVLTADGEPKITDFGLAKHLEVEMGLTPSGAVMGTPQYMAPEQAAGKTKEVGPLTDVYALGVILYELATGRPPFDGVSLPELLHQIQTQAPERPRKLIAGVDRGLEAIILKCLEKRPRSRYRSAQHLADDLERWRCGKRPRVRSWPVRLGRAVRQHARAAVGLVLLGLVVAAMATVAYFLDPDYPLRAVYRQLAAGQKVVLVGEQGPPPWFRWVSRDQEAKASQGTDGTFFVHASGLGLLQLLPDPQRERFRFQVEVRHDSAEIWRGAEVVFCQVGIYCLHSKHGNNESPTHCFCGLAFNDGLHRPAGLPAKDVVELFTERRTEPTCQAYRHPYGKLGFIRRGILEAEGHMHGKLGFIRRGNLEVDPADAWRQLTLEVTPEGVQAFWGSEKIQDDWAAKPVGVVTRFRIERDVQLMATGADLIDPMPDIRPTFAPRNGVGLYVYRGGASFRRVVVEPLAEGK